MINFYLAISGLSKLHSVHSGEYLSVIIIIIIGLPVAPNYKMSFLCQKKPEKPEKKCENNLYFSKHYMYIKTTVDKQKKCIRTNRVRNLFLAV